MVKTQEELNALKEEVKTLNEKLRELTDEELAQVTGGTPSYHPVAGLIAKMYVGMFEGCKDIEAVTDMPATTQVSSDNTHPGFVMSGFNGGQHQR